MQKLLLRTDNMKFFLPPVDINGVEATKSPLIANSRFTYYTGSYLAVASLLQRT